MNCDEKESKMKMKINNRSDTCSTKLIVNVPRLSMWGGYSAKTFSCLPWQGSSLLMFLLSQEAPTIKGDV